MNLQLTSTASIFAQGLAILVGVSILLGRIYSLTFYEVLGIPISEAHLDAIDYSIVSPDVTILGIGIAILLVASYWLKDFFTLSEDWDRARVVVGAGFFVSSIILAVVSPQLQVFSYAGVSGVITLLAVGLGVVTGPTLVSGLPLADKTASIDSDCSKKSPTDPSRMSRKRELMRLLLLVVAAVVVVYTTIVAITSTVGIAERDARNALLHAPLADVRFSSSQADDGSFGVVLIGDELTYLASEGRLYAFPTRDVSSIAYAPR